MSRPYLAIVGGQSLAGREVRNLLSEQSFPAQVRLIGADAEEIGAVTEQDAGASVFPVGNAGEHIGPYHQDAVISS